MQRKVGSILKTIMLTHGFDRHQLAVELGVSYPHVCNLVADRRPAGDDTLVLISSKFGVPYVTLLGVEDEALPVSGTVAAKGRVTLAEGALMRSVLLVEEAIVELGLRPGDSVVVQPDGSPPKPDRWYVLATPDGVAFARTVLYRDRLHWRYADTTVLIVWPDDETGYESKGLIVERRHRL